MFSEKVIPYLSVVLVPFMTTNLLFIFSFALRKHNKVMN